MIETEADLFRLFGGSDPSQAGTKDISFVRLNAELHDRTNYHKYRADPTLTPAKNNAAANRLIKQRFELTDCYDGRHYLLVGRKRAVRIGQSRLLKVGNAMRDPELMVQYLGSAGVAKAG